MSMPKFMVLINARDYKVLRKFFIYIYHIGQNK